MAVFIRRVNFSNTNQGANERYGVGGVPADAAGELVGARAPGGANGDGTVFDIPSIAGSDSGTPASFIGTGVAYPEAGLIADADADVAGTTIGTLTNVDTDAAAATAAGGTTTVAATTVPTLTTLVHFNYTNGANPQAGLIADAAGDLFGTTAAGGAYNGGTVFEIAKTGSGYASTPTTLVSLNVTNAEPLAGLIADAAGDLFGTTFHVSSSGNDGTVFEIAKTATGYASTLTTLVSFNGSNGSDPEAGLIADAAGDLFGTTVYGPAGGLGTVFEIAKTGSGYASTPTTLASFNGGNGAEPTAGLIADAAGDLFGTTYVGGANNYGTVFEIAKTGSGYASTPTTLVSFNRTNGELPEAGLIADAAGDLFGTTYGGGANNGLGRVGSRIRRCDSVAPRMQRPAPRRRYSPWHARTETGRSRSKRRSNVARTSLSNQLPRPEGRDSATEIARNSSLM